MAKNKRSELLNSIKSIEEELSRNNELSKEEREFEAKVEKAFKEFRIPSECIEEVNVDNMYSVRVVKYLEC